MVSGDIDFGSITANERTKAIAHVVCASFRKSKTENAVGTCVGLTQNVGDTNGKQLGFSGAWSCDNEDRAIYLIDGLTLFGIEIFVGSFKIHIFII